mgnify:CR=1 FL=1
MTLSYKAFELDSKIQNTLGFSEKKNLERSFVVLIA